MNDPWFDPNHYQGIAGVLFGLWGAWTGVSSTLVWKAKAWPLVLAVGLLFDGFSAVLLAAGLMALVSGQPFAVWSCLVGWGLPGVLCISYTLLVFRKRYRVALERCIRQEGEQSMQAEDFH